MCAPEEFSRPFHMCVVHRNIRVNLHNLFKENL